MESKTKNLVSVVLKNPGGSETKIEIGNKVYLLNPEIFQNPVVRRNQEYINRMVKKELGKGPYEILNIFQKGSIIYFNIRGRRKIMTKIITQYFGTKEYFI